MKVRGPRRSIIQPEKGMTQVSKAMKNVKPHWTSDSFQWLTAMIGLTNSVQPYCRFAIIIMATTAADNLIQRFTWLLHVRFYPTGWCRRRRCGYGAWGRRGGLPARPPRRPRLRAPWDGRL